jgi:hypothetical protein
MTGDSNFKDFYYLTLELCSREQNSSLRFLIVVHKYTTWCVFRIASNHQHPWFGCDFVEQIGCLELKNAQFCLVYNEKKQTFFDCHLKIRSWAFKFARTSKKTAYDPLMARVSSSQHMMLRCDLPVPHKI